MPDFPWKIKLALYVRWPIRRSRVDRGANNITLGFFVDSNEGPERSGLEVLAR
jgi:hypothetical protein